MIYYKRALQEDEYEIAIGEKATLEQIIKANEKLKNWADPPEYRVEDIVENREPSIERLVLLRQIKFVMDSGALEVGQRGSSTLYDILVDKKDTKATEDVNTFAKICRHYDASKHAVQTWKIPSGYSDDLREKLIKKHIEYLDIEIVDRTKFIKNTIYYKRRLQKDEYEIAISCKKPSKKQINNVNQKLKCWTDPSEYKVKNIVENCDEPSVEKLVFLRQIKLIVDSKELEKKNRGSSNLYNMLAHYFPNHSNIDAMEKINSFAKESELYKCPENAIQEWTIDSGYNKILFEDFVMKHTKYLNIERLGETKFKKKEN